MEKLEEEHCLAEAKRLALFASQEANREELKIKEDELRRLSTNVRSESKVTYRKLFNFGKSVGSIKVR